jgi:uncharacterized RDD family membrane protein YckC
MKKITELTIIKTNCYLTTDVLGNIHQNKEEYAAFRKVRTAGLGMRFTHFVVDGIIFYLLFNVLSNVISEVLPFSINDNDKVKISLLFFFAFFFWIILQAMAYAIFEFFFQKTPAKFLTQTVVIDEYGNKPDFRTIFIRSLIRFVPFDAFSFLFNENNSGWHDRWSGTWVVTKKELAELKRLQKEQADNE